MFDKVLDKVFTAWDYLTGTDNDERIDELKARQERYDAWQKEIATAPGQVEHFISQERQVQILAQVRAEEERKLQHSYQMPDIQEPERPADYEQWKQLKGILNSAKKKQINPKYEERRRHLRELALANNLPRPAAKGESVMLTNYELKALRKEFDRATEDALNKTKKLKLFLIRNNGNYDVIPIQQVVFMPDGEPVYVGDDGVRYLQSHLDLWGYELEYMAGG